MGVSRRLLLNPSTQVSVSRSTSSDPRPRTILVNDLGNVVDVLVFQLSPPFRCRLFPQRIL